MNKRTEVYWTDQAKQDLREIKAFIARNAPLTATAYIRKLRNSVDRLKIFTLSGQVVVELNNEAIREILQGYYLAFMRSR